jgi:hypothetical protein
MMMVERAVLEKHQKKNGKEKLVFEKFEIQLFFFATNRLKILLRWTTSRAYFMYVHLVSVFLSFFLFLSTSAAFFHIIYT